MDMDNTLSAVVEFDYKAKEPDEIDLVRGAIIVNIEKQDIGWWKGTLVSNGKTGMFPDNFVRVLNDEDEKVQVVLRDKSSTIHRRCKVVYSYTQNNEDELSLQVGNIIDVLGEVEEGWWRGKLGDKIGVFPSNFVVPVEASPKLTNKQINSFSSNSINSSKKDSKMMTTCSSLHSSREDLFDTSPLLTTTTTTTTNLDKDAPLLPPKPIREYCRVLFTYEPQNEDELELQVGEIITILSKELPDKGWWKGEIRGKVGVFPDNFVQLLPPEVSPSKDFSYPDRPPSGSSKVFGKKSGSASSSQGSNKKDSFGSRDSLNDILNETGIVSGSVAAQRKSLENKKSEITSEGKFLKRGVESKTSEIRKSLENMDEKKTPPPVLTKKPIVPVKKQTSVTSVAGNLLSGLKQKVKSVESKLSSHDSMDGICSSKVNSQIPDTMEEGIIGEKHRRSDSEFDNVERGSMLADMRAGRVKAPKRRPPSAAINVIGEGNNNSIYLNGGGDTTTDPILNDAKPKSREWERIKAPWMEELKASQAKKTSPSVEPRTSNETLQKLEHTENVNSKNVSEKIETTKSNSNNSVGHSLSSNQQRKSVETLSSGENKTPLNNNETKTKKDITTDISKSMSTSVTSPKLINPSLNSDHSNLTTSEDVKTRPTSLSIKNRSLSPVAKNIITKPTNVDQPSSSVRQTITNANHHQQSTFIVNQENVCSRVVELEQRIAKLETVVQSQNRIIEELVKSLKEETDKVKGLKTELDKYAQCVTQV